MEIIMKFENLLQLIEKISESSLTKFGYEEEGIKISMEVGCPNNASVAEYTMPVVASTPVPVQVSESKEILIEGKIIKSPLVGIFYIASSENADPYVAVGDIVKKGQTLAIVEAMKLMNEIEAEMDGKIAEIYVDNQQAIEYGQPLFRIV